jgi:hypothetical protein
VSNPPGAFACENQATTRGTLSYFGTYDVNESNHILTFHIVGSSFPNYNDTDQNRTVSLTGEDLRIENPSLTRTHIPDVGKSEIMIRSPDRCF